MSFAAVPRRTRGTPSRPAQVQGSAVRHTEKRGPAGGGNTRSGSGAPGVSRTALDVGEETRNTNQLLCSLDHKCLLRDMLRACRRPGVTDEREGNTKGSETQWGTTSLHPRSRRGQSVGGSAFLPRTYKHSVEGVSGGQRLL